MKKVVVVVGSLFMSNQSNSELGLAFGDNTPKSCWSCATSVGSDIFCTQCNRLQALDTQQNAFAYFGLETHYSIDLELLETRYLDRQKQVHPDRFLANSEQEKLYAAAHALFVNEAYRTLKESYERALHLLMCSGYPLPDKDAVVDVDFLENAMEKQEALAEASDATAIQSMYDTARSDINSIENELSLHFVIRDFKAVHRALNSLKYLNQFLASASKRLSELS
jgi:molecular chaperone HscB